MYVVESNDRRVAMIQSILPDDGYARSACFHEEERETVAVPRFARNPCRNNHRIGSNCVEYLHLFTGQLETIAVSFGTRLDTTHVVARARFLMRESDDLSAVDHRRKPRIE